MFDVYGDAVIIVISYVYWEVAEELTAGIDSHGLSWIVPLSVLQLGHFGACRKRWRLTDSDMWPQPRRCLTLSTLTKLDMWPQPRRCLTLSTLTKLDGGLSRLHPADDDVVQCLANYERWIYMRRNRRPRTLLVLGNAVGWELNLWPTDCRSKAPTNMLHHRDKIMYITCQNDVSTWKSGSCCRKAVRVVIKSCAIWWTSVVNAESWVT